MNNIPISDIHCEDNRAIGDLSTLIDAIQATGGKLLQPIILAPSRCGGRYEVVDGRRRFHALQSIGRTELSQDDYMLMDGNGEYEAAAYIANTERKPLSPLEEVQQICSMMKTMTAEEIAEKLGKTLNYVVSRSRLAELSGKWKEVLDHPEDHPTWTIGKLQMIAREPAQTQKEIEHLITYNVNFSLSELWKKIQYYHRKLADAPFSWQDSCRVCGDRSDRQQVLFAEDQPEAVCLDAECFEKKCFQFFQQQIKKNPQLKPVRNGSGYGTNAGKWADKNKVPQTYEQKFEIVEDSSQANGIICCGENIGRFVKIITVKNTQVQTSADTAAEKKAEKQQKAETKRKRDILRIAMGKFIDQLGKIRSWEHIPPDLHENVWRMIFTTGLRKSCYEFNFDTMWQPDYAASWLDRLLIEVIDNIALSIGYAQTNPQLDPDRKIEKELCKVFDWNWETLFLEPAEKEYNNKGK